MSWEHGTRYGYDKKKCRCEACYEAGRAAINAYRHRTGRAKPRAEYLASIGAVEIPGRTTADRMREYRKRKGEEFRARERERMRQRRENGWREDPVKKHARNSVAAGLRRGTLTREPCEVCGEESVEAHHPDYSKPREVRWLCRRHHEDLHMGTLVLPERAPMYSPVGRAVALAVARFIRAGDTPWLRSPC